MTPDPLQNQQSEPISEQDVPVVELSLKEDMFVAGGPQITNDGIMPPP